MLRLLLTACAAALLVMPTVLTAQPARPLTPTPAATCAVLETTGMLQTPARTTLIDFTRPDSLADWYVVDDGVMGGVSQGALSRDAVTNTALFTGTVRLENNGGFSSLQRWFQPVNLTEYAGIELYVCGDGQRYNFSLRDIQSRRVMHQTSFATEAGQWQTVRLPFSAMEPTLFGRVVNAEPLDLIHVVGMSLLISDGQAGPFTLRLGRIAAYRSADV